MIFGQINKLDDLKLYPEMIQKGLRYLRDTDFTKVETGKYELEGEDLFALVQEAETDVWENKKPEAHEHYVDIQYLVSGLERIGFAVTGKGSEVLEDMRPGKDLIFYKTPADEMMLELRPGNFAVFFPTDIHRPVCSAGKKAGIKKVVLKIRYKAIK